MCKEIVTAIKFLVEEGSYRYILSGSLLGIELKDIRSVPVGYMDIAEMYPHDFEEFAVTNGVSERMISSLKKPFEEKTLVDKLVHEKMLALFELYYFNRRKQGELGFLIERNGEILPIEIKSVKNHTRHAALTSVMENLDYAIPEAYVFQNDNVKTFGKITYSPIYMLIFMKKTGWMRRGFASLTLIL